MFMAPLSRTPRGKASLEKQHANRSPLQIQSADSHFAAMQSSENGGFGVVGFGHSGEGFPGIFVAVLVELDELLVYGEDITDYLPRNGIYKRAEHYLCATMRGRLGHRAAS
jgi:hypothetical protein